jgi:hypothetical protein
LPPPTDEEITAVAQEVCGKTIEFLKKKGIWKDDEESDTQDTFADKEPALAHAYQASVRGVLSTGPRSGQRVVRFFGAAAQDGEDTGKRPPGGFDLHAKRATFPRDRDAVERLARYILRPPLAQHHLERLPDGRVLLHLKRTWRDGTTAVVFDPVDLMSKLLVVSYYASLARSLDIGSKRPPSELAASDGISIRQRDCFLTATRTPLSLPVLTI